jgi:hypothetical protein
MTTVERPLTRKQRLVERLLEHPGLEEQDQIEQELQNIDTALHLLDKLSAGTSTDDERAKARRDQSRLKEKRLTATIPACALTTTGFVLPSVNAFQPPNQTRTQRSGCRAKMN